MPTQTDGLNILSRAYIKGVPDSFALFLGAGVNKPAGDIPVTYQTYTWPELLEKIYNENFGLYNKSFDQMCAEHEDDWPGLAEALVGTLNPEIVVEQIDEIIYQNIPRGDKDSRLSKKMLDQAPTLHAAICFSSQIKERRTKSWTFKRNPRVGAVITTNYDFFFGAGWTRYQAFKKQWKVHTPFSKKRPPDHGVIYYLHGYVPYDLESREELVLTTTSYEKYYSPGQFALKKLEEAIRRYSLIFLGISFQDQLVCNLLREAKTGHKPRHYAFVKAQEAELMNELGICPVVFEDYADIAGMLEDVYCSTLSQSTLDNFALSKPQEYWSRLKKGPRQVNI